MARTSKQRSTTALTPEGATDVVVVDGSNIATEGRSVPSLEQLDEAVKAFIAEYPDAAVTVVVDATFGHRIDKREVKAYDAAVSNNELVTPPAGAVGRGDAFVLSIADKVGARVLSNDSFQEFHGEYPWLFDDGRLVGGKPVPNIGWVFVDRVPVKGPKSRQSQRGSSTRSNAKSRSTASPAKTSRKVAVAAEPVPAAAATSQTSSRSKSAPEPVNDTLPFLEFVERHPVGTSVNVEVDSYASHGAYVKVGDVRAYVPLALMDDPAPTSARKVMSIGEALTLVVASYSPARRSIDLAAPHMVPAAEPPVSDEARSAVEPSPTAPKASGAKRSRSSGRSGGTTTPGTAEASPRTAPAETDQDADAATTTAAATETRAAKKSTAKRSTSKQTTSKKSAATSATAKASTATSSNATKSAGSKRSGAKRSAADEAPPAPDATASPQPSSSPDAEEQPAAKKSTPKKTAAKKTTAKKTSAKKTTAKRTTAAKKTTGKKAAPATDDGDTGTPAVDTTKTTRASGSRRSRSTKKGDDG